jgi:hypothetical protein
MTKIKTRRMDPTNVAKKTSAHKPKAKRKMAG